MSSGAGLRGFPGAAAYSATKAAQRMFAEALRHELAGTGVSVTTVYPGEIQTSLHDHEQSRMPAWYRGGPNAATAEALAGRIVKAVERDSRHLHYRPLVKGMGILHGVSPGLADRVLRRLRGATRRGTRGTTSGAELRAGRARRCRLRRGGAAARCAAPRPARRGAARRTSGTPASRATAGRRGAM